ncbi:uncharacterized protein BO80DRAFT_123389 [Aspergillus ibericus CBS 121593]|uniref:Uncharacterized protein n=1 Tax=Aspergillus ibericus CBS 121593 TaxID=1448316 RepID=A0A395GZF9_9EURO|nr:hypothetical protein BO80DRAFT_123389 [Aspergillus ibericus CBS 121593]RAK99413.1 hypothetical protein BO80DRAFT_123389 [Aspergillus ibericus CBS 121593]
MHTFTHLILIILTATALLTGVTSHPSPPIDPLNQHQQPVVPDLDSASEVHSTSLGIHYGNCYTIKDRHGSSLGSDGGVYSYYKFGSSPRTFQIWNTRAFPTHDIDETSPVPDGGKFYLWDPKGSAQTNGGSWVATNLGGYMYPGYGGYWYYVHFKGYEQGSSREGHAVKLGIARVEPPSPMANYKGLKVSGDYIWNQDNEDTIDVLFRRVSCDAYEEDDDDDYGM